MGALSACTVPSRKQRAVGPKAAASTAAPSAGAALKKAAAAPQPSPAARKPAPQPAPQAKARLATAPATHAKPKRVVIPATPLSRAQSPAPAKGRTGRLFLKSAAAGIALAIAATTGISLMNSGDNTRRVNGVAIDQPVGQKSGDGSGTTIIHRQDGSPIVKDQSRLPSAAAPFQTIHVRSFIINPETGQMCSTTETKTADDCRAEVGLSIPKKLQPSPAVEAEAEAEAQKRRAAEEEAAKQVEQARLAVIAAERAALAAAEAEAKQNALKARPQLVSFSDALRPPSLIPADGVEVPDRDERITYDDRLKLSAPVMKAMNWTSPQSVMAWHKGKAITVEAYLKSFDNSQLPHPEFMKYLIPHLEKHGFERMVMPDLKSYDRKYGLPVGLLNEIFKTETNGNCGLTSWARDHGAFGCIQIMIDTYFDAIGNGAKGRDPTKLDEAIDIAATWINVYRKRHSAALNKDHSSREYMDQLKAMYNSGPKGVLRALEGGKLIISRLKFCETQYYVARGRVNVLADKCLKATRGDAHIAVMLERGLPVPKKLLAAYYSRNARGTKGETAVASAEGFINPLEWLFGKPKAEPERKGRGREAPIMTYAPGN